MERKVGRQGSWFLSFKHGTFEGNERPHGISQVFGEVETKNNLPTPNQEGQRGHDEAANICGS